MWSGAVIELLGVPATGKSGLASALAAAPGTVLLKEHRPGDLPALLGGVVRAAPVLVTRPPSGTSRLRWVAWSGRLAAAPTVVRRRGDGGLVVLDQGPAYTLGRMLDVRRGARGDRWWQQQVRATARLLDLLVVLETDPEVLTERLRGRPKQHRAATLDTSVLADYLAGEQETCRAVAGAVAQAGAPVLRLDTGRLGLDEQVASVEARLRLAPQPDGSP